MLSTTTSLLSMALHHFTSFGMEVGFHLSPLLLSYFIGSNVIAILGAITCTKT
jgi:hypothetical protein